MTSATKDIVIKTSPRAFFKVISDYERYSKILPEMRASRIIERDSSRTVAQFTIKVIKEVTYTLSMEEEEPHTLRWTLVDGPFMRNSGFWELRELKNGHTHAHYSVDVRVGVFVPKRISDTVVGKTMPTILNHFKDYAEKHT